jgi:hypothetical protein
MPLHVEIRINSQIIETLHIGRLEGFRGRDQKHQYVVNSPEGTVAVFEHLYSDGARVCVERALAALAEKNGGG